MSNSDVFARRVYTIAGIYGLLVMLPQYFMEGSIGMQSPPAITHVEFFYGFIGVAVAWQCAFLLIGRDPSRYRALMPVTWIEKLTFGIPAIVLYSQGRLAPQMLAGGLIDLVLFVLFFISWRRTPAA